jgi:hypothetical protein
MLSKNFNVHSITHKSICNVIPLHMDEFVAIWDVCLFMCRVFDTSFCAIIILSNKSTIVLLFWGSAQCFQSFFFFFWCDWPIKVAPSKRKGKLKGKEINFGCTTSQLRVGPTLIRLRVGPTLGTVLDPRALPKGGLLNKCVI